MRFSGHFRQRLQQRTQLLLQPERLGFHWQQPSSLFSPWLLLLLLEELRVPALEELLLEKLLLEELKVPALEELLLEKLLLEELLLLLLLLLLVGSRKVAALEVFLLLAVLEEEQGNVPLRLV